MVERVLCMHEAQGSIPCSSNFYFYFPIIFASTPWLWKPKYGKKSGGSYNRRCSSSLVVMTSALHAEGREFNPPLEYFCQAGTMSERAE